MASPTTLDLLRSTASMPAADPVPPTIPPDTLLRRAALAEALTASGYPARHASLATMAAKGGGPPFRRYGSVPLYKWSDALAWAESRMSAPLTRIRTK